MAYRWGGPGGGSQGWGAASTGGGGGGTTQYPQGAKLTANTADATNDGTQLSFDNAANINLATEVYVGQNGGNGTFTDLWASLANGGKISVVDTVNDAACEFNVTAAVDSGTYWTLTVQYLWGVAPADGAACYVLAVPGAVLGPKIWRANVIQNGTAPLTATVIEDSLGGAIVWSHTGGGMAQVGTLAGAFAGNVQIYLSPSSPYSFTEMSWGKIDDDSIGIYFDEDAGVEIAVTIIVG